MIGCRDDYSVWKSGEGCEGGVGGDEGGEGGSDGDAVGRNLFSHFLCHLSCIRSPSVANPVLQIL